MPLGWKLLIDSTNAPTLADFWAAALEYEVEDPGALISQLLAAGHIGSEAVVEYRGRRIFRGYAAIRHPEDPFDETAASAAVGGCWSRYWGRGRSSNHRRRGGPLPRGRGQAGDQRRKGAAAGARGGSRNPIRRSVTGVIAHDR